MSNLISKEPLVLKKFPHLEGEIEPLKNFIISFIQNKSIKPSSLLRILKQYYAICVKVYYHKDEINLTEYLVKERPDYVIFLKQLPAKNFLKLDNDYNILTGWEEIFDGNLLNHVHVKKFLEETPIKELFEFAMGKKYYDVFYFLSDDDNFAKYFKEKLSFEEQLKYIKLQGVVTGHYINFAYNLNVPDLPAKDIVEIIFKYPSEDSFSVFFDDYSSNEYHESAKILDFLKDCSQDYILYLYFQLVKKNETSCFDSFKKILMEIRDDVVFE